MSGDFETCVEYGLKLSKRIYYGKEAPPVPPEMSRSTESYLPSSVMVYAVVPEPEAVDNPDVPSYQPYVHGRCEPPALIPLPMLAVDVEVDCWLDWANVSVAGRWRVHCIKAGVRCDCRVAVPMGEQGSLLGVEVDVIGRSYHSQLIITEEDGKDKQQVIRGDDRYLKDNIFTFRIPEVDGGATLAIKVTWSQKLAYEDGQFCLNVPFTFPKFVNPVGKKISKREKIMLNVNSATRKEILCKSASHALREMRREVGKMGFFYEAEVLNWSKSNFNFSYTISVSELFGGVLLQSPFLRDYDDRQMFCMYLFPGNNRNKKVFRKEVIFMIDMSGSMKGDPLESAKNAILSSLSKLNSQDSFNIIAFNGETYLFSSLMEPATPEAKLKASQWLSDNLNANGGTNILLPLTKAMKLLAETTDSVPLIFLITDGTVEDERDICNFVKSSITSGGPISPRICTFGIGTHCNHHFLKMIAHIGRGHFDCAYDADSVDSRIQKLFSATSAIILANITVDGFEHLDSLEVLPCNIPDLSCGSPLIISGRYNGNIPDSVKIRGMLADMSTFTLDLKSQKLKDVPLDRVIARREIDSLTAKAWLTESQDLRQKVANMSLQTGVPSEYTHMILLRSDSLEKAPETILMQEVFNKINPMKKTNSEAKKIIILGNLGVGFGNLKATAENIPPGADEIKKPEGTEMLVKAASNCCSKLLDRFCCMCFINTCSYVSDQCVIVMSQLCAALACFECINCCYELCN